MRILFVAAGSPATVFALVPLAVAAHQTGHQTLIAATADMVPVILGAGQPAVPLTEMTMRQFMFADRKGVPRTLPEDPDERMRFGGRGFGRLAAACLPALTRLAEDWRPDVVVGGMLSFSAALVSARFGLPYVRHAWDMGEPVEMDLGAADELRPELDQLGLGDLPPAALRIEICPPSVGAPNTSADLAMRFVPSGRRQALERWMYMRPDVRRVCVTAGSRASREHDLAYLDAFVGKAESTGAEVVVAAPDDVANALQVSRPGIRAGWLPLDVVLRTCDLLVHAGGGQTSLTALQAGVPQLIIPNMPKLMAPAQRLTRYGAAETLSPGEDGLAVVTQMCGRMLDDTRYRERAGLLADEIASLPGPADVVPVVEKLAQA